jgi:NAD+ synthase (glutamine-hydrolysing)
MTVKVAIAQMNSTVGDLAGNRARIVELARRAWQQGADIMLTPEMSLVGYPPEDLLLRSAFYAKTRREFAALALELAEFTDLHVVVGLPTLEDESGRRFNTACVLHNGQLLGTYHKHDLPNTTVFDEKRYFSSGDQALVFAVKGVRFGINICEDTWFGHAPARAREAGAQVLLVPNGSPYHMNKQHLRYEVMRRNVAAQGLSLVYANLVGGQDELIFDGDSFVMDQDGAICVQLRHFEEDLRLVEFDAAGRPAAQPRPLRR